MVLEEELLPYLTWLLYGGESGIGALPRFAITVFVAALVALVVGLLVLLVRHGPLKAGDMVYRAVASGVAELAHLSPRRIWALARLAVQEAIRRRVWVALVIFVLILLFASWFLNTNHQEPAKLYLSFVLTATTYLVLMIALLMSAFSLPGEFKSKTIYTIMTKPVRAGDVVLGRILGFTLVGTALLAMMGVASYFFVNRALYHTHEIDGASLENIYDADGELIGHKGRTHEDQFHRHAFEMQVDGRGLTDSEHGHEHRITSDGSKFIVEGPAQIMRARVPTYGRLQFLDRKGTKVDRGINVGNEWDYRRFVAGGTASAAIWTFSNVDESMLRTNADGTQVLPLEIIVRVFRTWKGDIERGIQGSIFFRNPETERKSKLEVFTAKDWTIDSKYFTRKLYDSDDNEIDLINDLVSSEGELEVWVQCLERGQYYGFAQADCYIRRRDASPLWNFCKAYLSIWTQMLLVIAIGVTTSTFLNGPVAMMATISFIILGFFRDFFLHVAMGTQVGGGPVESLVRLVTQKNLISRLEDSFATNLMHAADTVLETFMLSVGSLLPDFRGFSTVNYVAYGFNIPPDRVAQDLTAGAAFVLGMFVAGYFFLRSREVAK